MRKIVTLCTLVLMSISPLAFAQSVEDSISAVVSEAGDSATAYEQLISDDNETLSADQKAALAAMGPDAGVAFINAIVDGSSVNAAALIAVAAGASSEDANAFVAALNSQSQGSEVVANTNISDENSNDGNLLTETAAGAGTGSNAPIGGGSGAAGGGGGGTTVSTN